MPISAADRNDFLKAASAAFGNGAVLSNKEIIKFAEIRGYPRPNWLFVSENKEGHARYRLPPLIEGVEHDSPAMAKPSLPKLKPLPAAPPKLFAPQLPAVPVGEPMGAATTFNPNAITEHEYAMIPQKDPFYVPFGEYKTVLQVVESGGFFPVFISGHSGNGKTMMVEQTHSKAGKAMIRVQMSRETDEDDLIGGFRLINGETKFIKGPALRAMELGVTLAIDEGDRADPTKVMCLQGILEGKPYYVKKTGEIVYPKPGFNVILTANTKGKGSDDGRYVAATILDDAFLERFPITIEQQFPDPRVERKILQMYIQTDDVFVSHLIAWAEIIRKTYAEEAIDEMISTRRLVHIAQAYNMFGGRLRAIELCINRFDSETRKAFLDLYTKIDAQIASAIPAAEPGIADAADAADAVDTLISALTSLPSPANNTAWRKPSRGI